MKNDSNEKRREMKKIILKAKTIYKNSRKSLKHAEFEKTKAKMLLKKKSQDAKIAKNHATKTKMAYTAAINTAKSAIESINKAQVTKENKTKNIHQKNFQIKASGAKKALKKAQHESVQTEMASRGKAT